MFITNKKLMKELSYQNEKLIQIEEQMEELVKIHLETHDNLLELEKIYQDNIKFQKNNIENLERFNSMINECKGLVAMTRADFNKEKKCQN